MDHERTPDGRPSMHGNSSREWAILCDLGEALVLTTEQLWRLRFPGTSMSYCRGFLKRLADRRWIDHLPLAETRSVAAHRCWVRTEAGAQVVGAATGPGFSSSGLDTDTLRAMLGAADEYVRRRIEEKAEALIIGHLMD